MTTKPHEARWVVRAVLVSRKPANPWENSTSGNGPSGAAVGHGTALVTYGGFTDGSSRSSTIGWDEVPHVVGVVRSTFSSAGIGRVPDLHLTAGRRG